MPPLRCLALPPVLVPELGVLRLELGFSSDLNDHADQNGNDTCVFSPDAHKIEPKGPFPVIGGVAGEP